MKDSSMISLSAWSTKHIASSIPNMKFELWGSHS